MIDINDRKAPRPPKGGGATSETNSPPLGGWGASCVKPYNQQDAKAKQVGEMFDSIAPAYDFMNTAMTGGLHRWWRDRALSMAIRRLKSGQDILDVACGTGDVTFRLHKLLPDACVTGTDLSEGMINVALNKLSHADSDTNSHIRFETGDCLALKYPGNKFDLVTVAYGVRNFERLQDGYAEMYRVLKPGGVLCVIELSEPTNRLIKQLYRFYSHKIIPMVGKLVSHDPKAYTYLPESIAACPQRKEMTAIMDAAGFRDSMFRSLTLGVITIYLATK